MSPEPHAARTRPLNGRAPRDGRYVLYWMQQSQRARANHALEVAVRRANQLGVPVLVGFGLTDGYPEANLRSYRFMLEGLAEISRELAERGVPLVVRRGAPDDVALDLAEGAASVVCDRGYLRHQKRWRARVGSESACEVLEVECDVVVPVAAAAANAQIGARTLRPRIHAVWDEHLVPVRRERLARAWETPRGLRGLALDDVDGVLAKLDIDRTVDAVTTFHHGGTSHAVARLRRFLRDGLPGYAEERGKFDGSAVAQLSMYLHFGQIAPVEIALAARDAHAPAVDRDAFLEELVVRRELACNFCEYVDGYDRFDAVPRWARATLREHAADPRPRRYDLTTLERAETDDPVWNASMRDMRHTGYLHNRLRMYWGKKILEWTRSPEDAFAITLALNNKWFLDGRDPASYANVAWTFGLHDRPFGARPVYGVVRSMTASGLDRKGDVDAYLRAAAQRARQAADAKRATGQN